MPLIVEWQQPDKYGDTIRISGLLCVALLLFLVEDTVWRSLEFSHEAPIAKRPFGAAWRSIAWNRYPRNSSPVCRLRARDQYDVPGTKGYYLPGPALLESRERE